MHAYEPRTFDIPALEGISQKSLEEHLGLYAGYVKNCNAISKLTAELWTTDYEKNALAIAELVRRRSFEFDGMRLHEYYFEQLEGGGRALDPASALGQALEAAYRPVGFEKVLKGIASIRGPGWAILYYDARAQELLTAFVGEQHHGHFATLPIVLALDVWEHAYLLDHGAAGRAAYVEAFLKNLNWGVIEDRYAKLSQQQPA